MHGGGHHVGHFLLTNLLMPLIERGEAPRIVNLSSRGHHIDRLHFDDPNYDQREYNKWEAYGQSKTANILFSVGLERRLADKGIHAYAVHPGQGSPTLTDATVLKRVHFDEDDVGQSLGTTVIDEFGGTSTEASTVREFEGICRGGVNRSSEVWNFLKKLLICLYLGIL